VCICVKEVGGSECFESNFFVEHTIMYLRKLCMYMYNILCCTVLYVYPKFYSLKVLEEEKGSK